MARSVEEIRPPLTRVTTAASTFAELYGRGRAPDHRWHEEKRDPVASQGRTLRFNQIHGLLSSVTQCMFDDQLRELEADGFVERRVYAPGHRAFGAAPLKVRLTVPSPAMLTTTSSRGAGHCVWTRLPVRTICPARSDLPRPARLLASHANAL